MGGPLALGLVLWAVFSAQPAQAVFSRGGGLGVGARAMGMGGAFVAVADDPSGAYWNPAGLVQLSRIELSGMYGSLFNDKTRNTYFTVHYPTSEDIHLSLSASNLFFTELDGPHEDDYSASMAIPMTRDRLLSAGLNFRYLYADLKTSGGVARGRGVDLGLLYRKPLRSGRELSVGLCVTDLSTSARFSGGVEQVVPRIFTPGFAFHFNPETLVAFDLSWTDENSVPGDERFHIRGGLEHWIFDHRLGFRTGYISYSTLPGQVSLGTSYNGRNWSIDYAYLNHPRHLGNSHRISAGWRFNAQGELGDVDARPYRMESLVGDKCIQLRWSAPEGMKVDGYWVYLKGEEDKDFHRVQPSLLTGNHCLLRGAENGSRYKMYVTAVVAGKEGPPSSGLSASPRPMSAEAQGYYEKGMKQYKSNRLSAALYATRKAEELDPNNYEIKDLLRKLENAQKKGLIE